jgi:hypothetical protein
MLPETPEHPALLPIRNRILAGLIGTILIGLSIWIFLQPPIRTTRELNNCDNAICTKETTTDADPNSLTLAMLIVGSALLAFGINGLKLTKFSSPMFGAETANFSGKDEPVSQISDFSKETLSNFSAPSKSKIDFEQLSPSEKKILKTLWPNQKAYRGPPEKRWGFKVSPQSPEFLEFTFGLNALIPKGIVGIGAKRGLVYLTDAGIKFCEESEDKVLAYPHFYKDFAPLE